MVRNEETYAEAYRRSIEEPERFWAEAAESVHWVSKWNRVLDASNKPFYRWFVGGTLNTCYNALDYHVETGRGEQTALIHDSPVTGTQTRITYESLRSSVARFAGMLRMLGLEKGDRVVIYMPMIPEAAIAMLGCARIGVIHSVVFGGFAPKELAKRINDARPKVVVAASCGIEGKKIIPYKPMVEKALEMSEHKPDRCVIFQREQLRADLKPLDVDWHMAMSEAKEAPCVPVSAEDPLYILYTSGTTGTPKGVVRDNGGHAVALKWSMKYFYNVRPGQVFWAASDVGWVVGHSYIIYGPLLTGCTTVMYEGKPVGTPDPGAYWRVISEHRVSALFTAPTALRAIKREDPKGLYLKKYDISSLEHLFVAGERLDPDTYVWAQALLGKPVIDHWWQTETGWPIAGTCVGLDSPPAKPGSCGRPVPGYDVRVVGNDGKEAPLGEDGLVVVKLPLPPGCLLTLWNADDAFLEYVRPIPEFYLTGDAGHIDTDGCLFIMGRTDEVINVAGHRLSTGAIEEILARHPAVAECAVVGVMDGLKGQVPFGFVVRKAGDSTNTETLVQELTVMVREELGPIACFNQCIVVDALPKTRSGKVLRKTMSRIADGKVYEIPPTIEDSEVLRRLEQSVRAFRKDEAQITAGEKHGP